MKKFELLSYWITGLLIVLLPTQLGLHFWPEFAIVAGRRVDYFSPTLYITDILILLLLVVVIVSKAKQLIGLKIDRLPRSLRSLAMTKVRLLVYCLTGLLIYLNISHSYSPAVSFYKWIKVWEFGFLLFCLRRTSLAASRWLLVPVLYESILAVWQFLAQSSVGGLWYFLGERTYSITTPGIATVQVMGQQLLRPYGTFSHPNVLGGFLAVVLPLILGWLLKQKPSRTVLGCWAIELLSYLTLIITFSRAAIIVGLLASLGVIIGHMKLGRKRFVLVGVALLPLLVFFLPLFNLDTEAESFSVRGQLNGIAIREWLKSPIVGTGLGTSPLYTLQALGTGDKALVTTNYSLYGQPVHNVYLMVLSETGILGILGGLGIVFGKRLSANCWPLFAILALGLFDHYLLTSQQGLVLVVVGFSISYEGSKTNIKPRLRSQGK